MLTGHAPLTLSPCCLMPRVLEHKDISWRCGIHPPITAAEFAAVKSNAVLANSLMNKTKASVMQMEVTEADDDHGGGAASIMLHVWRSEMLSGVVEVDRDNVIQKAGCCPLHQAGELEFKSSSTWDGLVTELK